MILKEYEQRYYKKLFFQYGFCRVQSPTCTICCEHHLKRKWQCRLRGVISTCGLNIEDSKFYFVWADKIKSRPRVVVEASMFVQLFTHGCINHLNLEMEPKYLMKSDVQLNPNIVRTKNNKSTLKSTKTMNAQRNGASCF